MYPVCKQSNFHWVRGTPCHITSIYSVQLYYLEILLIFFFIDKTNDLYLFSFLQSLIHNVFKAHILVQFGKIYIVFVKYELFTWRFSHSYYVLFIHVLTFSRVFLYNVIKRNNNLDIIHRGKKKFIQFTILSADYIFGQLKNM